MALSEKELKKLKLEIDKIPDKEEIMPGIFAVPLDISPSTERNLISKVMIKLSNPLGKLFCSGDWRRVVGIFNSIDLNIKIHNIYDLSGLNELSDDDVRLQRMLGGGQKVIDSLVVNGNNMKKVAVDKNLIYRSNVTITENLSPVVNIHLYKQLDMDYDVFVENLCTTERYTLMFIYFHELISFLSRNYKIRRRLIPVVEAELKNKQKEMIKKMKTKGINVGENNIKFPKITEQMCLELVDAGLNFFSNYIIFDTIELETKDKVTGKSNFMDYISNPLTMYAPEINKARSGNRFSDDYKFKKIEPEDYMTQAEVVKKMIKDATPIMWSPSGGDSDDDDDDQNSQGNSSGGSSNGTDIEDEENQQQDPQKKNSKKSQQNDESHVGGLNMYNKKYIMISRPQSEEDINEQADDGSEGDSKEDIMQQCINNTINKLRGFGCSDILSALGIPIEIKMDWSQELMKLVEIDHYTKSKKSEATWAKNNIFTRHLAPLPSLKHFGIDITLYIAVDSSGSMSDDNLKKINFMIKTFSEKGIPMVIFVHDDADGVKDFVLNTPTETDAFIKCRFKCGGTSHRGVFRRMEEYLDSSKKRKKAIAIIATDMYSDIDECWKEFEWPKYVSTYFVTETEHASAPFGKIIIAN